MTQLLDRAYTAATFRPDTTTSVRWRGCLAALWAVAVGVATLIVVVLIAWASDSRSGASAGAAVRTALQLWLLAHRVPLRVPGGALALPPLGLTLLLALVIARAAAVVARGSDVADVRAVGKVALAVAAPYAVLSAFVAAAATSPHVHPHPLAALGCSFVVGVVAATWGALRGVGLVADTWSSLPRWLGLSLRAGAAAVGVLLAVGMALVLGSLVVHLELARSDAQTLGGGSIGSAAVVVLSLAYLPNAALAAVSYLAGPGFAVGTSSSVTLSGVHVGAVPTLPLFAALPHAGAPLPVRLVGIAALVAAAVLAGWMLSRDGFSPSYRSSCQLAIGSGAFSGLLAGILVAIAGGSIGPGRMSAVGASPWQAGLVIAGEIGLGAAAFAAARTAWQLRRE